MTSPRTNPVSRKGPIPIETVADLVRQRNAAQRAVYNLTRANKQLLELAELCSRLNWNDAPTSIKLVRASVFGPRYDELGLCELECDAAFGHPNSAVVVLGYRLFAQSIQRQLEAALRRKRATEAAAGGKPGGAADA